MIVCGVDLSGPSNVADTAVVSFMVNGATAVLLEAHSGVGDAALLEHVAQLLRRDAQVVVGLDAPLSYNPGGGDRPADRDLRRTLQAAGLPGATVMTPTMTRMVYLTLRGISIARLLDTLDPRPAVAEVHPAGTLVLHGAPAADVRALKRDAAARQRLVRWLEGQGLGGTAVLDGPGEHLVAATAAALAAWRWAAGRAAWRAAAQPPLHPFDYVC